jgi:hypothetical protein
MGIAVLGSVFSAVGGLGSPGQFTAGLTAALTVSAAILAASALVVLLAPEMNSRLAERPTVVPATVVEKREQLPAIEGRGQYDARTAH